jgi:uncharacterized protein (DUF1800 family)
MPATRRKTRARLPDENYAREVMQLFSIGTECRRQRLDAQGPEIYTLNTVSQMARVFTGWNVDARRGETGPELTQRPMVLTASLHSTLAVDALGMTIPAGTDGSTALRLALDRLAGHANVGPFIGRQLIQRLVTSNPSPAYVARVGRLCRQRPGRSRRSEGGAARGAAGLRGTRTHAQ